MSQSHTNDWRVWIRKRFPKAKAVDHDWTMVRYNFPQYVRDGIMNNWIKVSDDNSGTWYEKNYYNQIFKQAKVKKDI